jgi:hypothetical protein
LDFCGAFRITETITNDLANTDDNPLLIKSDPKTQYNQLKVDAKFHINVFKHNKVKGRMKRSKSFLRATAGL